MAHTNTHTTKAVCAGALILPVAFFNRQQPVKPMKSMRRLNVTYVHMGTRAGPQACLQKPKHLDRTHLGRRHLGQRCRPTHMTHQQNLFCCHALHICINAAHSTTSAQQRHLKHPTRRIGSAGAPTPPFANMAFPLANDLLGLRARSMTAPRPALPPGSAVSDSALYHPECQIPDCVRACMCTPPAVADSSVAHAPYACCRLAGSAIPGTARRCLLPLSQLLAFSPCRQSPQSQLLLRREEEGVNLVAGWCSPEQRSCNR